MNIEQLSINQLRNLVSKLVEDRQSLQQQVSQKETIQQKLEQEKQTFVVQKQQIVEKFKILLGKNAELNQKLESQQKNFQLEKTLNFNSRIVEEENRKLKEELFPLLNSKIQNLNQDKDRLTKQIISLQTTLQRTLSEWKEEKKHYELLLKQLIQKNDQENIEEEEINKKESNGNIKFPRQLKKIFEEQEEEIELLRELLAIHHRQSKLPKEFNSDLIIGTINELKEKIKSPNNYTIEILKKPILNLLESHIGYLSTQSNYLSDNLVKYLSKKLNLIQNINKKFEKKINKKNLEFSTFQIEITILKNYISELLLIIQKKVQESSNENFIQIIDDIPRKDINNNNLNNINFLNNFFIKKIEQIISLNENKKNNLKTVNGNENVNVNQNENENININININENQNKNENQNNKHTGNGNDIKLNNLIPNNCKNNQMSGEGINCQNKNNCDYLITKIKKNKNKYIIYGSFESLIEYFLKKDNNDVKFFSALIYHFSSFDNFEYFDKQVLLWINNLENNDNIQNSKEMNNEDQKIKKQNNNNFDMCNRILKFYYQYIKIYSSFFINTRHLQQIIKNIIHQLKNVNEKNIYLNQNLFSNSKYLIKLQSFLNNPQLIMNYKLNLKKQEFSNYIKPTLSLNDNIYNRYNIIDVSSLEFVKQITFKSFLLFQQIRPYEIIQFFNKKNRYENDKIFKNGKCREEVGEEEQQEEDEAGKNFKNSHLQMFFDFSSYITNWLIWEITKEKKKEIQLKIILKIIEFIKLFYQFGNYFAMSSSLDTLYNHSIINLKKNWKFIPKSEKQCLKSLTFYISKKYRKQFLKIKINEYILNKKPFIPNLYYFFDCQSKILKLKYGNSQKKNSFYQNYLISKVIDDIKILQKNRLQIDPIKEFQNWISNLIFRNNSEKYY
ncbi:guanine nucleotide exchange factor [Anaeramoeba flamelloides]|uniref:Guanine nucleotide exchange factor n=1 Tax=Anaeramoeba flamelloides TaxID=1746091 RepID=A0AAV7YXY3_9EUKA|nr:guanine nucleotide exchange factor [Anaeramoeba flamelloides]